MAELHAFGKSASDFTITPVLHSDGSSTLKFKDSVREPYALFNASETARIATAFTIPAPSPTPTPTPEPTPTPTPIPASAQSFGANIQRLSEASAPREASEVGAHGDIRVNVAWNQIETSKGAYNWTKLDAIMAALPAGRKACLTITGVPGWANGGLTWKDAPLNPADYGSFCGAVAKRYLGKTACIEVWNEANSPGEPLSGTGGRSQERCFGEMYEAARIAVAGIVPTVTGGPYYSSNQLEWLKACIAQGKVTKLEGVAIHPYSDGAAPTNTTNTHTFLGEIEKASAAFPGVPIWLTEFGIRIGEGVASSETARATYLSECFAIARAHPQVAGAYWYQWRDYGSETFGLVSPTFGAREPVTAAFSKAVVSIAAQAREDYLGGKIEADEFEQRLDQAASEGDSLGAL